jgi:hypothetical protein
MDIFSSENQQIGGNAMKKAIISAVASAVMASALAVSAVTPIEAKKAKSPEELFGDFYRKMYGCEISDEEMQIIKEAAKEAGVIDETD